MSPPEGPEDTGAFGNLTLDEISELEDTGVHVHRSLVKRPRAASDWSYSFLCSIHRDLFASVFGDRAGVERRAEVALRDFRVPRAAQIHYRLADIVRNAQEIIQDAAAIPDEVAKTEYVMRRAARLHADCVVVQPFIDGNKRWATFVVSALLIDSGFSPGTAIEASSVEQHGHYLNAIGKAVADEDPDLDPLGDLILSGWLALRDLLAEKT
jgi:fido (protein-threonine AMPylation protein)